MKADAQAALFAGVDEPLAARMRPRTLDEFVGQGHILAPGRLLRRAIAADQLGSLIFHGPPGTGKTTLARVIARTTRAEFTALNAVLSGVKDIREAVAAASERQRAGRRTILFVDEVHRFNKAQQDALLPWVENGTVILIGATTENPYFEVNKALVSRSRIFQLVLLEPDDLRDIARAALADRERGFGALDVRLDEEALEHLVDVANGDARSLLNALELAVLTTEPEGDIVHVTRAVAEESIQRRAVLYDKEGDAHFDVISAFIKSVRGSDPDAALYWLAKMVYAGEDPRFLFRRMLILASEDVGLADPSALVHTRAAAAAFDTVGMPEGRYHLAQAALYLANAPKSNSTLGFFDALAAVEKEREGQVPTHLKDANRDADGFGHGAGYLYPHAYREHFVAQQYLPSGWRGRVFYRPSGSGAEAEVRTEVGRRRDAQLAAMAEGDHDAPGEILTAGPGDRQRDRWAQRAMSGRGRSLATLRDAVFERLDLARHHLVLDLRAGTGLFAFEALRRVPEGQVWCLAASEDEAEALREAAAALPELERPVVLVGDPADAAELVEAAWREAEPGADEPLRFDAVLGRDLLVDANEAGARLSSWASLLRPGGTLLLAEAVPREGARLHELADAGEGDLPAAAREAEEAAFAEAASARFRWRPEDALPELRAAGLEAAALARVTSREPQRLAPAALERWFGEGAPFRERLVARLDPEEIKEVEALYRRRLIGPDLPWRRVWALLSGRRAS